MIGCVFLFFWSFFNVDFVLFVFYKMAKHVELKLNQVKMLKTDFPPPLGAAVCILFEFENVLMLFFHFIRKAFTLKLFSSTDPLFCEGFYIETCTI